MMLLRECWHELFALGLAQCSRIVQLDSMIISIVEHLKSSIRQCEYDVMCVDFLGGNLPRNFFSTFTLFFSSANCSYAHLNDVTSHVLRLQEFVLKLQKLDLSVQEFAYLKAITLFSPGSYRYFCVLLHVCFFSYVRKLLLIIFARVLMFSQN